MSVAKEGDIALLISKDGKRFMVRLQAGGAQHTHRGMVSHDQIIGQPWGREIMSHREYPFLLLQPSIHDLLMTVKRLSQIVYPKEIGYLLLKMNIGPGAHVIEAGTGSGAMAIALAHAVRPTGRVYSYEQREDMLRAAARNLERVGLSAYVELKQRDIGEGFDERDVDALFLDVREPWLYLAQAREALTGGGFFGALVPTTNQVSDLVAGLELHRFADIEVAEILLRGYKAVAQRLRPEDRMVGHTGYMIFARQTSRPPESGDVVPEEARDVTSKVAEDDEMDEMAGGETTAMTTGLDEEV